MFILRSPKHPKRNPFKWNIIAYAKISSSSTDKEYTIVCRQSIWGRRYICTCPDHIFRDRECKHIRSMKGAMKKFRNQSGIPILMKI